MPFLIVVVLAGPGVDVNDAIRRHNQMASLSNVVAKDGRAETAGSFSPLSSLGHAGLAVFGLEPDWLCAVAGLTANNAASKIGKQESSDHTLRSHRNLRYMR
jgi:hypothetical protein